jgi:integrase
MAEAKTVKAQTRAEAASGVVVADRRVSFAAYARDWIATYAGRTSRGFRESTRDDYLQALEKDAIPFFGTRMLTSLTPPDIRRFAAHVGRRTVRRDGVERPVSSDTVRLALAPVKALLATAFEDGLIPVNPAAGVRIIQPQRIEDDEPQAKALSDAELERLLAQIPQQWAPMILLIAYTGIRIGEGCALQIRHLDLERRRLLVRRTVYRGVIGPPKSRYGRRVIPLAPPIARVLQRVLASRPSAGPDDLLFPSTAGTMLDRKNVLNKVLKPAARRAGVPWAGLHTLRHTFASRCFREGCNAKQVQLLLGHHSAAFTLETYIHLLPEDLPSLDFLDLGETERPVE